MAGREGLRGWRRRQITIKARRPRAMRDRGKALTFSAHTKHALVEQCNSTRKMSSDREQAQLDRFAWQPRDVVESILRRAFRHLIVECNQRQHVGKQGAIRTAATRVEHNGECKLAHQHRVDRKAHAVFRHLAARCLKCEARASLHIPELVRFGLGKPPPRVFENCLFQATDGSIISLERVVIVVTVEWRRGARGAAFSHTAQTRANLIQRIRTAGEMGAHLILVGFGRTHGRLDSVPRRLKHTNASGVGAGI